MWKKLFIKFLISNLAILSLPLLFLGTAQYHALTTLTDKYRESSLQLLKHWSEVIDERLIEIRNHVNLIYLNKRVLKFSTLTEPYDPDTVRLAHEIIRDLTSYSQVNRFFSDFFLVFRNSKTILTTSSKYDPALFYKHLYKYEDLTLDEWELFILGKRTPGEFLSGITYGLSLDMSGHQFITYRATFSSEAAGKPDIAVVFLIDRDKLNGMLQAISTNGLACLIAPNSQIIASAGGSSASELPSWSEIPDTTGSVTFSRNGNKYILLHTMSSVLGWKYVLVMPEKRFFIRIDKIFTISILSFSLALGIGFIVSFLTARREYGSIKKLSNRLSSYLEAPIDSISDDLEFIRKAILTTIEEDKQLKTMIDEQRSFMRFSIILDLLQGRVSSAAISEVTLKELNINFISDYFAVILCKLELANYLLIDRLEDRAVLRLIIIDIMETETKTIGTGFCVETENLSFALLINARKEIGEKSDFNTRIIVLAKTISNILEERLKCKPYFGVSRVHNSIRDIYLAYRESLFAVEYLLILKEPSIIAYDDISSKGEEIYYPLHLEKDLIRFVTTGDWENASYLTNYLFKENIERRKLSLRLLQVIRYELIGTTIKILQSCRFDKNELLLNEDPEKRILECESVDELKLVILEIFKRICSIISKQKLSRNQLLKDRISKYIQEHFAECTLSQSQIAKQVGITPSYLSHFFKEQFGLSMVDYINNLRLSEAKRLFESQPELSISEVANRVGCWNDKSLIRIFKKYEGVTPGKYRNTKFIPHSQNNHM
ncbi:MAG: AraC family transcriptional regulator [Bacteroidales bacterium]